MAIIGKAPIRAVPASRHEGPGRTIAAGVKRSGSVTAGSGFSFSLQGGVQEVPEESEADMPDIKNGKMGEFI
jgi:hypothetical protein